MFLGTRNQEIVPSFDLWLVLELLVSFVYYLDLYQLSSLHFISFSLISSSSSFLTISYNSSFLMNQKILSQFSISPNLEIIIVMIFPIFYFTINLLDISNKSLLIDKNSIFYQIGLLRVLINDKSVGWQVHLICKNRAIKSSPSS